MALKKALPEENLALKKALPEGNWALKIDYRKRIGLSNIITGRESDSQILLPEMILAVNIFLYKKLFLCEMINIFKTDVSPCPLA